jgi:hypothetical protein
LTISTTVLPQNFFDIPLTPDCVKFKFLNIFSLKNFEKVKSKKVAFDKCKIGPDVLADLMKNNPDLKSLQLVASDVKKVDFSVLKGLDELHLIYTLEDSNSIADIKDLGLKKLVISGDLVTSVDTKKIISDLRKSGTKVEIKGPQI